jgi:hypothetical protein
VFSCCESSRSRIHAHSCHVGDACKVAHKVPCVHANVSRQHTRPPKVPLDKKAVQQIITRCCYTQAAVAFFNVCSLRQNCQQPQLTHTAKAAINTAHTRQKLLSTQHTLLQCGISLRHHNNTPTQPALHTPSLQTHTSLCDIQRHKPQQTVHLATTGPYTPQSAHRVV